MGVFKANFMEEPLALWSTVNPVGPKIHLFDTYKQAEDVLSKLCYGDAAPRGLMPSADGAYIVEVLVSDAEQAAMTVEELTHIFPLDRVINTHERLWRGTLVSRVLLGSHTIEA